MFDFWPMQSWQFFRQNTLIPRWEREIRVKLKLMLWVPAKRLGQKIIPSEK